MQTSTFSVFTNPHLKTRRFGRIQETRRKLGFVKVREFSQLSECLDEAFANTEKVLYCLYKIILKATLESKTLQASLCSLI